MKAFILLQLRDKRQVVLGLLAVFALTLPIGVGSAILGGASPYDAGWYMSLVWGVLGVPIGALAIGANAGAGQREAAAERTLPLSHLRRMAGSLTGAVLHFALFAAAVTLGIFALNHALGSFELGYVLAVSLFVLPASALGLICGFVGAYLTGNTVSGIFAGAAAGVWAAASVAAGWYLSTEAAVSFPSAPTLTALLAVAGGLAGLAIAPSFPLERSAHWRGKPLVFTIAAAAAFFFSGVVSAGWTHVRVIRERWVFEPYTHEDDLMRVTRDWGLPTRIKGSQGILLRGVRDDLYWAAPDGSRRQLIPPNEGRLAKAYRPYFGSELVSSGYDKTGDLWVVKRESLPGALHYFEVWNGDPERGLTMLFRVQAYDASLRHIGDQLWLVSKDGAGKKTAILTPGMKGPDWKRFSGEESLYGRALEAGNIPVVSDRHFLFKTDGWPGSCRLPRRKEGGEPFNFGGNATAQRISGGKRLFLVPTGYRNTALVDSECRVLMETQSPRFRDALPALEDGRRWIHDGRGRVLILTPAGKIAAQIDLTEYASDLGKAGADAGVFEDVVVAGVDLESQMDFKAERYTLILGSRFVHHHYEPSGAPMIGGIHKLDIAGARAVPARGGVFFTTRDALWYRASTGYAELRYLGPM